MITTTIVGLVMVLISWAIGCIGINKIEDNTKEVNLSGLKIDASNEHGIRQGYVSTVVAILLALSGFYLMIISIT